MKNNEALVIFAELAATRRDHFPTAAGDNKTDLNMLETLASGEYVPDEEHFTKGSSFEKTGRMTKGI